MKKNNLRLGVIAAVALAFVLPQSVVHADDTPTFGKACTQEGVSTGTSTDSLICKNLNGKLVWQKVRLGATYGTPVKSLTPPKGTIEFHHWRPEDKAVFQTIIDKFQAANPGTKITQVISTSTDYTVTGLTKVRNDNKAAIFVTSRGGQFNDFYNAGLMADLSSQRFVQNNVIQSALTPGTVGGKIYGVPYQSLFNNPLYNAELFAKNGWKVPTTWSQTLAFCKTAKAAGYIPLAWPAARLWPTSGCAAMRSIPARARPE